VPLRVLAMRKLLQRFPVGSYTARLNANAVEATLVRLVPVQRRCEAKALGYKQSLR